jgi:hypothetical protein
MVVVTRGSAERSRESAMPTDFEGDAFISYAHLDNICLSEGRKGWVSNLQRALQIRVAQLLGKESRIFWDPKLRGNDLFSETLLEQLRRVCALVSVVSPRYIRSEWGLRELGEFCTAAERQGGVHVHDKSRLFKVLKTPVPLEQQPAELRRLLGYEFFRVEPETGRVRELDEIFGPEAERDFWLKLDDLAHDLCSILQLLHSTAEQGDDDAGAVFLAETTSDLRSQRDDVRRGLQQQGYLVLPLQALPLSAAEAAEAIRTDLARCQLSVHMVGGHYGLVPEGSTSSLLEIQHELAVERAAAGGFSHLVWIPRGVRIDDARQEAVVERLRMDDRVRHRADLLETPLEDLRTVINAWLGRGRPVARDVTPGTGGAAAATQLYLIYDSRDQAAVTPWADFFFQHVEVVHPCFEGDETEIRDFHEENLESCDGAIIFCGASNQMWLRRKLAEVQKSAGYGRTKAPAELAVLLIPPETPDKRRFKTHLASVVPQFEGVSPEALAPFVEALRARTGRSPE